MDAATSQQVFRSTLRALAEPGLVVQLPDVDRPLVAPVRALADLDVTVATIDAAGDADDLGRQLRRTTGCRLTDDVSAADMVVSTSSPTDRQLAALRTGDAYQPELGARLFVGVERVGGDGAALRLAIGGPGIPGTRHLSLDGVDAEAIDALMQVNGNPPAGVDTWFIDPSGRMVALARTTKEVV